MHLQHFSHQHTLEFKEHQMQSHGNKEALCSECNKPVIGVAYCCNFCEFYLHESCAKLPLTVLHPLHPQHTLTLLAKSPYPESKYRCGLCRNICKGFVYHCSHCGFKLDSSCAFRPVKKLTSNTGSKSFQWRAMISNKERKLEGILRPAALISEGEEKFKGATDKLDKFEGKRISNVRTPFAELEFQKPELVSFGPYHSREEHRLDKYKYSSLEKLLSKAAALISEGEEKFKGATDKIDKFEGKRISNVKPYKGKDIVKEDKNQSEETENSGRDHIPTPCIFRTPFPELEFQKPELVSIGPYHSREEHQLDKYKYSSLEELLSKNPERDLRYYVGEILALEKRARACYRQDLVMSSGDFVKMMLVDGCFIIELLHHYGGTDQNDSDSNDQINIIMPWQIPILVQDLLMLENQIPFFIIEKLYELSDGNKPDKLPLITMALKFFDLAFPQSSSFISESSLSKPNHLLDLFVKAIHPISNLPRPSNLGNLNNSPSFFKIMGLVIQIRISDFQDLFTATNPNETEEHDDTSWLSQSSIGKLGKSIAELRQAGIEFVPSRSNNFFDVKFKHGRLAIPVVTINNLFNTILVNSMALEFYDKSKVVTNHIYLMSRLIKEASDVKFLSSKGIISRFSNNDKEVADLFRKLGKYAVLDTSDSKFKKTIWAINSYNGQPKKNPMRLMENSLRLVVYSSLSVSCLFYMVDMELELKRFLVTVLYAFHFSVFVAMISLLIKSWYEDLGS